MADDFHEVKITESAEEAFFFTTTKYHILSGSTTEIRTAVFRTAHTVWSN